MSVTVRGVDYFYVMVKDRPGEAYRLLSALAAVEVNLLAFNAIPMGPEHKGDDRLGALADIHPKLFDAHINVYASSGVTDGRGGYGYILYVRPEDFHKAELVLGI